MDLHPIDLGNAGLDLDTLKLTVELYLQDLHELQAAAKGKGKRREGETTDLEMAIATYEAELASVNQHLADRAMCASIADAVRQDAIAISEAVQAEEQARQDRQMACSLGGVPTSTQHAARPSSPAFSIITEPFENDFIDKLSALYISDPDGEGAAESSAWAASRRPRSTTPGPPRPDTPAMRQCVMCRDDFRFYRMATFPCQHHMCQGCLVELFTRLLTDQTLFPPRCCREPIALDKARFLLGPELVGRFLAKKIEYETSNPTYCSQPTCSQFIPPHGITNDNGGVELWLQPHYEEALMAQANRHVNRDAGAGRLPEPVRQQRVAAAAQHLLENHECAHARWKGRGGRFQCEECHDWLPQFIYECQQCRLLACRRCRFNRL
ncbi:uncharacterized protein B0T23DRAFT_318018 [Neurospora hispaniola]|uniref:RING-type domain-containing protein n=1 Tax=Neurospora hispaniola TaxID=588809 RepID=A0AAJ0I6G7_9PEZI|nr:hypothetical protein B0T23DRAFT_318018 [Neurospora hispaniola]